LFVFIVRVLFLYFWAMYGIIFFVIIVSLAISGYSMAPWVPTRKKDIKRVTDIVILQDWEKFLEVWAWDARISAAIARKYPNNSIVGIEMAFPIYFMALIRKYISGPKNMKLKLANAFKEDFWNYHAIYVFGMPDKMQKKIVPKFLKEAKSWAKLYSYVFSIPEEWRENTMSYGEENEAKIHVLEKI